MGQRASRARTALRTSAALGRPEYTGRGFAWRIRHRPPTVDPSSIPAPLTPSGAFYPVLVLLCVFPVLGVGSLLRASLGALPTTVGVLLVVAPSAAFHAFFVTEVRLVIDGGHVRLSEQDVAFGSRRATSVSSLSDADRAVHPGPRVVEAVVGTGARGGQFEGRGGALVARCHGVARRR